MADGTTATEFAINAAVSLFTELFVSAGGASFVAFVALRLARCGRCVAAGAGDSSVIVLNFRKSVWAGGRKLC